MDDRRDYIRRHIPKNPKTMAEIFINVVVRQDRQKRIQLENFKDSLGRPAAVDGGVQELTNESGAAELGTDPNDSLQLVVKSDIAAESLPATTVTRGFIDTRVGEEVNKLDVVITTTTIPAEAVAFDAREVADEPRA